jgi:hypothetical protein
MKQDGKAICLHFFVLNIFEVVEHDLASMAYTYSCNYELRHDPTLIDFLYRDLSVSY